MIETIDLQQPLMLNSTCVSIYSTSEHLGLGLENRSSHRSESIPHSSAGSANVLIPASTIAVVSIARKKSIDNDHLSSSLTRVRPHIDRHIAEKRVSIFLCSLPRATKEY